MTVWDTFLASALLLQVLLPAVTAGGIVMQSQVQTPRNRNLAAACLVIVSLLASILLASPLPPPAAALLVNSTSPSSPEAQPLLAFWRNSILELSIDRNRAGLLALTSWISLTGLFLPPLSVSRSCSNSVVTILWLHTGTVLLISAEHIALFLTGWSLVTFTAAAALSPKDRTQAVSSPGLFATVQIAGMTFLSAGLALAAGTAALMKSAPYGPPRQTSFSLHELAELLQVTAERHPAAAEIHSQVADLLMLTMAISLWLGMAIFPCHGWLTRIWEDVPLAVRLWLGTIGLKVPILRLYPHLASFTGASYTKLLLILASCSLAGLVVMSGAAAVEKKRAGIHAYLILITTLLTTLYLVLGNPFYFLPVAGLSAGVVLLLVANNEPQNDGWSLAALLLASLAIGFVPGGPGFLFWKELISLVWLGLSPVSGSLYWVLVVAAAMTTVAILRLLHIAQTTPRPGNSSSDQTTPATPDSANAASQVHRQALILAWGGVVVLLSALAFASEMKTGKSAALASEQASRFDGGIP